jgi:hypothetical protein
MEVNTFPGGVVNLGFCVGQACKDPDTVSFDGRVQRAFLYDCRDVGQMPVVVMVVILFHMYHGLAAADTVLDNGLFADIVVGKPQFGQFLL